MIKPKIDKKTLKYGSASIILAVIFISLVFVVNLVVTALTEKFNLYVDLTEEQLYEISESSFDLLSDMGDEEVKFIFLTPLDELDNNNYTKNVKTLALEYEEKFDNITIEYVDMLKNPTAVTKYRKDYTLSSTTVIVESAKRFVAFDISECFVYSQDESGNYTYYAFNGEYRFTSALLRVTNENSPKAIFTINHGETVPTYFKSLLADAGFEVVHLDLSEGNIPSDAKLVVINDPQTDFTGLESEEKGKSEITKLSSYLENGGNAMIFVDPQTPVLKNLDELCALWGIGIEHGYSIADDQNSIAAFNSQALISRYDTADENLKKFHTSISQAENPIKTVSFYTVPLKILPLTDVSRRVGTILSSYATSYVPVSDTQNLYEGVMPLLVAGYREVYDPESNDYLRNYLIVGGSTYLAGDVFLHTYQNTYANSELIKSMVSEVTNEVMLLEISYKVFNDTTLTIDNYTSRKWLMALVFVLPALVLVASLAVFIKRRHL
ncbi:MAG: hypothetical protein E7582_03270 [Ruminococcaceae bacterium]|nr:hypothetical protein [Oscillospiraceae bacterium]